MKKRYWIVGGLILYAAFQASHSPEPSETPPPPAVHAPQKSERRQPDITERRGTAESDTRTQASPKFPPAVEITRELPTRYVSGNRVAFRAGPSTTDAIIDRFDQGRQVLLITENGDWSQVRDVLTQREGWLVSRYLGEEKPVETRQQEKQRDAPTVTAKQPPTVSDSVIVQRIIAESIASYPGSCPCPYNTDRGGRRCGKRSAYSRPGGYAPICFAGDVTGAMIEAFRRR